MPNFFINVKEKGAKQAAGNIGVLTGSMKKMAAQVAIAAGGVEIFRKAIGRSAEIEGVRRGFDNLANSAGFTTKAFDKFKKATDGTIDNLTLMKQANNAMLLGITDSEDQMADMFDVAQRLGQSIGIDTVQSIESLVVGLGRNSKMMLDNLGIMLDVDKANRDYAESIGTTISQLTDQDRKTAFVNAAMKEANFLVEQLGAEQLTTKDKIAQMNTALLESLTAFGNLLTPFVIPLAKGLELIAIGASSVIEQFGNLGHEFTGTATSLKGFNVWLKANEEDEEALKNKTAELNAEQKRLKAELAGLTSTGKQAIDFTKDFSMSIDVSGESADQYGNAITILSEDQAEFTKRLFESGIGLDEYIQMQEESTLVTINDNTERAKAIQFLIDEAERKKGLIKATKQEAEVKKSTTQENLKATAQLMSASAKGFAEFRGGARIAARLQQASAIVNAYATINKIMADPKLGFPANVITATAVGASAFANVMSISSQIDKFARTAATGADFVTSGKQLLMVGDNPSGREHVQVTPLGGDPSPNAPSGGNNITLNISAPLVDDTVVDTIIPAINEAIRRGETLATS